MGTHVDRPAPSRRSIEKPPRAPVLVQVLRLVDELRRPGKHNYAAADVAQAEALGGADAGGLASSIANLPGGLGSTPTTSRSSSGFGLSRRSRSSSARMAEAYDVVAAHLGEQRG